MSAVVRLSDHRRKPPYLHFTRAELNGLLGLYATRVSKGEWRDYAIHLGSEAASFMVFRHSQENPLYIISKLAPGRQRTKRGQYMVHNRQHRVIQAHTLTDVLAVFDRLIKLVSS